MCMTLFGKLQYLSSSVQSPLESETWGLESCQAPLSGQWTELGPVPPRSCPWSCSGTEGRQGLGRLDPTSSERSASRKSDVRSVYQILPLTQRGRGRRASEEGGLPGSQVIGRPGPLSL
ncbi:unnamed protein product [Pipistrellus nathusii]|uniref:Uncharacterized protein n=1 Tax=Pipistrellus nathusii TaxID=59473 RepID=A0ABP0A5J8_PIPNA